MKVDQKVINGINRNNILELIRLNDPISRTELAKRSNLSLPAVMKITDELVARGIVTDNIKGKSTGGKPPKLLKFNYRAGYIIGVDIDYHRIDAILMDLGANVVQEASHDIHTHMTSQMLTDILVRILHSLIEDSGKELNHILGIGISTMGVSDSAVAASSRHPLYGCDREELRDLLEQIFGLQVYFESSIYAKAIGEKMVGNAQRLENFLFVDFDYEIEAAIVIDRHIYYGDGGKAGAIGHMVVDKNGLRCACGKRGCLNTIAGQKALGERARAVTADLEQGEYSMMLDMVYGHIEQIDFYTVIEAAENQDKQALEILMGAVEAVGETLNNLISLLDLETIIVSGKIVDCSKSFISQLKKYIKQNQTATGAGPVTIRTTNLGRHIGAIGAATNVLSRFLKNGMADENI